jgi:predicted alpha/beta hydrolase family esterase
MQSTGKATLLIVPGLRGEVPQHWQSLLAAAVPGARSIPPMSENGLSCTARVAAIEAAVAAIDGPVILVAHSAGVLMVAHWAALATPASRRVAGALLAAAPDLEAAGWPASYPQPAQLRAQGWSPLPGGPLPFPSLFAASSDDYLCGMDASRRLATAWGSELVELGAVGHLNPAAGYGPWPGALLLIERLRAGDVAK